MSASPLPAPPQAARPTLDALVRRLIWSFVAAIVGSWGLIIPRLYFLNLAPARQASRAWLYSDAISLSLAVFGVLLALYWKHLLRPRLDRLKELGEAGW